MLHICRIFIQAALPRRQNGIRLTPGEFKAHPGGFIHKYHEVAQKPWPLFFRGARPFIQRRSAGARFPPPAVDPTRGLLFACHASTPPDPDCDDAQTEA
jgi:hypothetical protein